MVLNKRVEFEVSELLSNARETVAKLENTTTKMHDIINEAPEQTRSPRSTADRRNTAIATRIIAFLMAWVVVLCSFLSISFYYFTQHIHTSVDDLTKQVMTIQKIVTKPLELPPVVVTWPAGNLPPPTDEAEVKQPSHNSTK